jgi:mannose-1-phosphate guanylyltransferase
VPTDESGRVTAFLEKMDNPISNSINAGCYVFNPSIVNAIPKNTVISVEREIFPELISNGRKVFGFIDNSYWLDIGTPKALLQGSRDLVNGSNHSSAYSVADIRVHNKDSLIMATAEVDFSAIIDGASCIGADSHIGADAHITGSIIDRGVIISAGARVINSFIASGAIVSQKSHIEASFVTKDEILPIPE